jgi:imidazolonepropionase-like amidohydrolase
MLRPLLAAVLLTLFALPILLALPAAAQNRSPLDPGVRPVTKAFAITNARVVAAPGRVLDGATVVVRDGLIEVVGDNGDVPFDAEVIDGDSLTVYAGFIDALGHAAIPEPEGEDEDVRDPGNPPLDRAGIQPERDTRDLLRADEGSVEALRALGFTVAHTVPHEGMLPGQGAVILLAGDDADGLVLRSGTSLFAQFDTADGVYPATPMGIMAALRQHVRDAARLAEAERLYAENPAGLERPVSSPALTALAPTALGEQPVFFAVDDVLEAHRALKMADELGLDLVLGDLRESSMLVDKLGAAGVPALASLDLPEAVEDTTAADSAAAPTADEVFITERRTRSYADVDDETEALKAKRREAVDLFERNAATLQEAGIPFAFATLEADPSEIRTNLRRIVAAGLSEDAALAALTTSPASLLGLDRSLGTVEEGKMANLVVTKGSYFDEDAPIRLVVVNGERFEVDEDGDFDPTAEVEVVGTWSYRLVLDQGVETGTMTIKDEGGTLGGTITVPDGGTRSLENVTLDGNRLSFRVSDTPFGVVEIAGLVTGDTYEAEITGPGAPALTLSATRRPDRSR